MKMNNWRLGFGLSAVVLAGALSGAALAQDESDLKVLRTGRQMGASDIPTLDPTMAEDVPSVQIIWELFPGLARLNEETAAIQPGMATWTASEDGRTYTFDIMPEISWVRYNSETSEVEQVVDEDGNPRYVTAADFQFGIERTLDPANAAPYSYVIEPWIESIEVLGDYSLAITTPEASAVTPFIFDMWGTYAQPSWAIEENGEFWIEPEFINTYGPFALASWTRGDGGDLTLVKNPFWMGTDSIPAPMLDRVEFRFLDEEPQLAEFEAGNLDVAEAPGSAADRIATDEMLSAGYFLGSGTCTYYYGFNVERAPFDDARVRRAFSMAIDRAAITENVTGAGETPAALFALPSLNAAPTSALFPDIGIQSDPEAARALWDEYLAETGASASDFNLTLIHNESGLHSSIAAAVQQMWTETLGITVNITVTDFATYLETRGDYDVFRAGWCFDYPDSHNFYYDASWHSDLLEENDTHFSNAEYDALVDEAFVTEDVEARRELYAQADDILVNTEAAIAPIYYYVTNDLTAPNVTRTHSLITREAYEKWDIAPAS